MQRQRLERFEKTWWFSFEIGCLGFSGKSTWRALKMLGVTGKEQRTMIDKAVRTAEYASLCIWNRKKHTNPNNDTNDLHASAQLGTSLSSKTSARVSATIAGPSYSSISLTSKTSYWGGAAAEPARRGKSQHHQCAVCVSVQNDDIDSQQFISSLSQTVWTLFQVHWTCLPVNESSILR